MNYIVDASFIVLFLPALACLVLTLFNVLCWKKVYAADDSNEETTISVLIPARNEEANLADCLDDVLAQGRTIREILIYDDNSTDSTSQIIAEYADRDMRIHHLPPVELPSGWCGKTFACSHLASQAKGDWLLFLDADARLRNGAARMMFGSAEKYDASFLSCWVGFDLVGFWERILMPMLNFVVFTLYPAPLAMRRRDASLGLAHGACVLVRRDTYVRLGGHGSVAGEIFEDVKLARRWREHGEFSLCLDGQDVVRVRMYNSFSQIWRGFQKNFYPAFSSHSGFVLFIFLHFTVFLLPFILLPFAFASELFRAFILAALCVFAMRFALAVRFRHPIWSVLFHPLAEVILLSVGISSWWKCKTGCGVEWKGRSYYGRDQPRRSAANRQGG